MSNLMLLAVLKRSVELNKEDNFNSLNQFTSRWVNVNYMKFDAIGSYKEVCIVQQERQFHCFKYIYFKIGKR